MPRLSCFASFWLAAALTAAAQEAPAIVTAARSQIGVTVDYDGSYAAIAYPNGDLPIERGVCTDVVIRAMRKSHGLDLQQAVHLDMKANFQAYPKIWGLKSTDRNIDHRRVPNLQTFFKRKGWSLPVGKDFKAYQPGDLVTCMVGVTLPHIMIVSDKRNAEGIPLVIHNIGGGAREEDCLQQFPITGHYRPPAAQEKK
ncbi:MAG TPA: DUF1287 domain-containing protein [Luteolibacter sp.]|nr:DUF1287 domain-containing protein [Luteolibacter sp.]